MLSVLAHQGGWDEILLFIAPIALAFFVIRAMERRSRDGVGDEDPVRDEGCAERS